MLAAYKDKTLNMELGVIGGKLLEALEKSTTSGKGLPLAPVEGTNVLIFLPGEYVLS